MYTCFESHCGFMKTIQNYIQMNRRHRDICVGEIRGINSCQGTVAVLRLRIAGRVDLQVCMQLTPLLNFHWNPLHTWWRCLLKLANHISLYITYMHEQLWVSLVRRQLFRNHFSTPIDDALLNQITSLFVATASIFQSSIFWL